MEERFTSCHGRGHFIKIKLERGKKRLIVNDEEMRGDEEEKKKREAEIVGEWKQDDSHHEKLDLGVIYHLAW